MFMLSLAFADSCVGIIRFLRWEQTEFEFMFTRKIACKVITSMEVVLVSASIYHFLGISLDRLFLIKYPLQFNVMKTHSTVCWTILVCWLLATIPAAPLWTVWDTRTDTNTDMWNICSFPYYSVSTSTHLCLVV